MRKYILGLILIISITPRLFAQDNMARRNGHFLAQLDFFGNYPYQDAIGRIKHALPSENGLRNTADIWYQEKGIKVRGLVQSATLQTEWWGFFGEPTEQYSFKWMSSGWYEIGYTDKDGKEVVARIAKAQLQKYPDLLKRFNYLAPTELEFEVKWRMGKPEAAELKKFEEKYKPDANFYSGLGRNYLNTNRLFTTVVLNSGLLFEPSGSQPFAVPGIRPGKGAEFLGVAGEGYSTEDLKRIMAWWLLSSTHRIDGFRAVRNNWPVDEMKAIAEKFAAYERGEEDPSPKQQVAKADSANRNTQAYTKDDFWGNAMEEEANAEIFEESSMTGLKVKDRIIISYKKDEYRISPTENKKVFLVEDKCFHDHFHFGLYRFIDNKGNIIKINGAETFYGSGGYGNTWGLFMKKSESDVIRELLYQHSSKIKMPAKIKSTYAEALQDINNYDNTGGIRTMRYFFQIMEVERLYLDFKTMSVIKSETMYRPFYKKYTNASGTKNIQCY